MLANHRIALLACVLLPLAGGCGSRFAGEWLQESAALPDGTLAPVTAERRLALQFSPPSTVRLGFYVDAARVVEEETVASSDYQTIQNRTVAQFGAYTARVEGGQLVTYVGAEEAGRFRRLRGPSVFPPLLKLPQFVRAASPPTGAASPTPPAVAVAVAE